MVTRHKIQFSRLSRNVRNGSNEGRLQLQHNRSRTLAAEKEYTGFKPRPVELRRRLQAVTERIGAAQDATWINHSK